MKNNEKEEVDYEKIKSITDAYKDYYKEYYQQYYEEKIRNKPNAIQIIAFGMNCFALGISVATLIIKVMN